MHSEQMTDSLTALCRAVPADAIAAEIQNHPAKNHDEALASATQALAIKALLLTEAERLNVEVAPIKDAKGRELAPEDARIEALLEREVVTPKADEETCRRFYERHHRRFCSPELAEVSHILFAAPETEEARYAQAVADAISTIAELNDHPERFAEHAAARSACTSASQGGNLGQIGPGQTVKEFEAVVFQLEPGQLCPEPVKTRYGAHVVRMGRRIAGKTLPFELAHEKIADYLEEASWRRAVAQYIRILADKSHATAESDSPLVQ